MKKTLLIFLTCILCNSCSILFDPLYEVIHQDGTDVVYYRYDRYYRPVPPPPHHHYHPKPVHPPKPKPPHHHKPKPAPPQHKPAPHHNGHKPTPPSRPQPKPNHNRR